jgi:hypothetical protein
MIRENRYGLHKFFVQDPRIFVVCRYPHAVNIGISKDSRDLLVVTL